MCVVFVSVYFVCCIALVCVMRRFASFCFVLHCAVRWLVVLLDKDHGC